MPQPVTDWRHAARGAHHWLDEAADLERRLGLEIAEARAKRGAGADISHNIVQIRSLIERMGFVGNDARREKGLLDAWLASQTRGFLRGAFATSFRAQFAEQFEIYNSIIQSMPDTLAFFNSELASLGAS